MKMAINNKLFSLVCTLILISVPFLSGASLPLEDKHQDEVNSTKNEFLNPESSKTEQSVNHQITFETTDRGNVEHNDGRSINLDVNTGSTTSQPFQTIQNSSVSKPTQGTTPIHPYIDIDDDQHTKIATDEISKDYSTTTTAPPPLENKLDKESLQPIGYQRDDENVTTTPKTFSSGKTDDLTFDVNVTTTSSPELVVNNLTTKNDQDDHVEIKLDLSSQSSKEPVQNKTDVNTSSSITQSENGNIVSTLNATVNVEGLTNGNNESRSSTPSVQNDTVPKNVTKQDMEKVMLSNKDNETLLLDDLDEIISKRHYYTSNDFNGNTSDDNINLNTKARDITEPTPTEIQTSSQPATVDNISEAGVTTESQNTSTIGILKEEITTNTPSTPNSLPNITITEKSTAATTTPVSTSTTSSTVSSSPPSTNATLMPPLDKPENNTPVHQFFMDLRAHTVLCLISLLLLLLAGTIIFSFVLAIIYAIKYSFIGLVKLCRGFKRCCPKRKKSSNSGFHESGSLFPRCDVSIRPYDPSNPNDRDMY